MTLFIQIMMKDSIEVVPTKKRFHVELDIDIAPYKVIQELKDSNSYSRYPQTKDRPAKVS